MAGSNDVSDDCHRYGPYPFIAGLFLAGMIVVVMFAYSDYWVG